MKRRDFLKAGCYGAALFTFSGLTLPLARRANAATLALTAQQVIKPMVDNASVPMWQFVSATGGPGDLPSGISLVAGEAVTVTLTNNLPLAINFVIPGVLSNTPLCQPGATQTYTFTAPDAGSYMYYDGANGEIGRAMGLSGPLVVLPADGSNVLYPGGPAFDQQYTLTINEIDTRLNAAVAGGGTYDMANYEPNYFFVNGLSYPDSATDADTRVVMTVGQRILLRMINTGLIYNSMHFHGYHVLVSARNRIPETAVIDKDTVLVAIDECVDVILPVTQAGEYELHNHFLPAVTANGVYSNGAVVMMVAA